MTSRRQPEDPRRPRPGQQLPQYSGRGHPRRVCRMERTGGAVPDPAQAARVRDPLLHPRSRWSSDRGGPDHGPRRRLDPRSLASPVTAHEQAAHLPRVVGQAGQAAPGDHARALRTSPTSSPGRPRSTRGGPPSTGSSSSPRRSISPRSCSPRTTGPRRMRPSPARRRRATTWCSRPGCSAARSASGARSSSTRTVRSCRATCSG